ncbi:MAG: dTDP-4-keto-6-deoxy-D-glucose epimerase [Actinobacteria bacterium]|nr:dTDP-4-keto-6-deoxy-D-glucose epimerase [Actinomycetota bacterium]
MPVRAEPTAIPGCTLVHLDRHADARGDFVKGFAASAYAAMGCDPTVAEVYWSTSRRATIRGMHFQVPPHAHAKTVCVVRGSVHDVVIDLRVASPAFRRHVTVPLNAARPAALHVPLGCAHGFQALEDDTLVAYLVGTEHDPGADTGVRWDSIGVDWPLPDPIVSERDAAFVALDDFASPFTGPVPA